MYFFISDTVLFILLFLFFKFPALFKIFLDLFIHSFFWDLDSSLLSLLWIIFQVDCLFPLNYFCGFYLVSLSETYFSLISFCLTFCACGLSTNCRVLAHFVSVVCLLVHNGAHGAFAGFLFEVTSTFPLVGGAGLFISSGQGYVKGCI